MDYGVIAEQLIKKGFSKNSFGSPEKAIGNLQIAFVEHPFYHVVIYSRIKQDERTLISPGDIKIPKACNVEDVLFVINSLVEGISENKIVIDIFARLNPDKDIDKNEGL